VNNLNGTLGRWKKLAAGRTPTANGLRTWRDLDAAQADQWHTTRTEARSRAYLKSVPARYATAGYGMLRPHQDPAAKVSRWLDAGPRVLVVAGTPRMGKTTAAYAIANDAHSRGMWVVARSAIDLSAAMKPDADPSAETNATECDLLLIDDLGWERVTDWWLERLHHIVDARCANRRRLLVTTNHLSLDAVSAAYGEPILERLIDEGGFLLMDGPPIRRVVNDW
jgi:DNA replication protein DnaC